MNNPIKSTTTNPSNKWWNSKYSQSILKLDFAYINSILLNYFGDNFTLTKGQMVQNVFHAKPEFTCEYCGQKFSAASLALHQQKCRARPDLAEANAAEQELRAATDGVGVHAAGASAGYAATQVKPPAK